MKTVFNLLLFLALFGLAACNGDDPMKPGPTIALSTTTGQDLPGEVVSTTITIHAPAGGDHLTILVNGVPNATYPNLDLAGETSTVYDFNFTVPNAPTGSVTNIKFQAIDGEGQASSLETFLVTVGLPVEVLPENINANLTLDNARQYLIKNHVFVNSPAVLTIPEGTIIKGDKVTKGTLIIKPGASLVVNGTAANPVVFTSSQGIGARDRGDWGGIVWLGNAFVNQTNPAAEGIMPSVFYGNNAGVAVNATENSGTMRYARIEYAGIELVPGSETNSLTMGALGSGTTIEYVQVSYGADDGFEWFGGSVNAKYLISHSVWDDDFDTDYGWRGKVQFGLVVRNSLYADILQSNSFESNSGPNDNAPPVVGNPTSYTQGVFSNITVFGPRFALSVFNSSDGASSINANYQNSFHLRGRTAVSIFNSVIVGFPSGVRMDGSNDATYNNYVGGSSIGVLANNVLIYTPASSSENYAYGASGGTSGTAANVQLYWESSNTINSPGSVITATWTALGLREDNFFGKIVSYPSNPDFTSLADGSILNHSDLFTNSKFTGDPFWTTSINYKGAFDTTTDWTNSWSEFAPLNKPY